MRKMEDIILQGNSLAVLKTLSSESVNCIITSPPYWALRDYGTKGEIWDGGKDCLHEWKQHQKKPSGGRGSKSANVGANKNDVANVRDHVIISNFCHKCGAWKGSFGLEPTFELYIKHLCDIFDEIKRVLKKDGTCWVNIGDTYGGTSSKGAYRDPKYPKGRNAQSQSLTQGMMQKSLLQIPSRFAIEMTSRGWILRNEIIWYKPNCMPSSATDRFTVDFEKVFFFSKSKKYHFEQQLEPATYTDSRKDKGLIKYKNRLTPTFVKVTDHRTKRTVWKIATKPYRGAHFATFPELLIEPMIKAGCPQGGVCLDPFMGAGTTGLVAKKLGRHYLGIELNPKYIAMAKRRIKQGL